MKLEFNLGMIMLVFTFIKIELDKMFVRNNIKTIQTFYYVLGYFKNSSKTCIQQIPDLGKKKIRDKFRGKKL